MKTFRGQIWRAALAAGAMFAGATSAEAATQSAVSRALALRPISLVNTSDLDFGSIVPGATAGTVTINARTGARTRTVVTLVGGTFSRARFASAATVGRVVTLTVNAPTITLTSGANTMTVNTLRVSANGGAAQTLGRNYTVPTSGVINFDMGGRLNVAANKPAGLYSGTFALTLNYQ